MIQQEVKLSLKQVQRYETLRAVAEGRLTVGEAALALGLSRRQVQRLLRRVEAQGPAGVIHGNQGRQPANAYAPATRDQVLELAATEYGGFNFSHLADTLAERHRLAVSAETLRRWLRPLGHGAPSRRVKKHRRRRQRRAREGELLFLDGSPHRWFGPDGPEACLLLCSDDATGKPLWGHFQPQEDRDGCFRVCHEVFTRLGLPAAFYLDRASQFTTTRHGGTHVAQGPEVEPTQFERAMDALTIGIIFANSPQARGRGERLNGSFQGRLVAELTQRGIQDCPAATRYLNQVFIPKYQRRFAQPPEDPTPAWRPIPQGINLKQVLCARYTRTVANDNTVRLDGVIYQLKQTPNRDHLVRANLEVQKWFNGQIHFFHPSLGEVSANPISSKQTKNP
jgi:transposase